MTEIREPVRPVRVDMACDRCEIGRMRPTGDVFASFPATYEHRCHACGHRGKYRAEYPFIEYQT